MSLAGDRIHALLREHRGAAHAITAPMIAHAVWMDVREVRKRIAEEFPNWIKDGGLLLSRPGIGFFFATDVEEIVHRDRLLISLWLQSGRKVIEFHEAAREAGFGGVVLWAACKIIRFIEARPTFKTFLEESHPEKWKEAA